MTGHFFVSEIGENGLLVDPGKGPFFEYLGLGEDFREYFLTENSNRLNCAAFSTLQRDWYTLEIPHQSRV